MERPLLNLTETARLLSIHPETLRRYALDKKVRSYKLPAEQNRGELRFDIEEVREDLRKEPT